MSGIGGYINFSNQPAELGLLKKMASTVPFRGPDGIFHRCVGSAGFSYFFLKMQPEDSAIDLPFVSENERYMVTLDARIDNRSWLVEKLLDNHPGDGVCDAQLILLAYRKWGRSCPKYIHGDFVFVIWDGLAKTLFAARDHFGCKPFYYHQSKNGFYWASEVSQLKACVNKSLEIDEVMVARDLVSTGSGGKHRSYFKEIKKIAPAETLLLSDGVVDKKKYWQLSTGAPLNYRTEEEYAEHFFELFSKVISDRLQTSSIGLFLSGGLDSSTTAATIKNIEKKRNTSSLDFKTFSFINSRAAKMNEDDRSSLLARRYQFENYKIDVANYPLLSCDNAEIVHLDEPYSSFLESYIVGTMSEAQLMGSPKVWMTGHVADIVIGGVNMSYFKTVYKRDGVSGLVDFIKRQSSIYGVSFFTLFFEFFIRPNYIAPLKQKIKMIFPEAVKRVSPWIDEDLVKRTDAIAWMQAEVIPRHYAYDPKLQWKEAEKFKRYAYLSWNKNARTQIWFDRLAARFNAQMWHPWMDKRLHEFVLQVPESLISKGLENKLLLRTAMRKHLPKEIVERKQLRVGPADGAQQDFRFHRPTITALNRLLDTFEFERYRFLDKIQLQRVVEDMRSSNKMLLHDLWLAISLMRWLQQKNL